MNKADLVEAVRSAADLTKGQAESAVETMVSEVMSAVSSGDRVTVAGFGSFNPSSRAARTGRNPQTGEPVRIAASTGVRFAPATAFKQALNPRSAKKSAAKKSAAKKSAAKKSAAKKSAAKKSAAKKAPSGRSASAAGKTLAKKASKTTQKKQAAKTLGKKGGAASKASAKKAARSTKKR
ncbi:MAG: HU family DNA-binding protein [Actinomycetota bacterium]|nr:HU family DNA-binding protein [Actinomycetota bacterium]